MLPLHTYFEINNYTLFMTKLNVLRHWLPCKLLYTVLPFTCTNDWGIVFDYDVDKISQNTMFCSNLSPFTSVHPRRSPNISSSYNFFWYRLFYQLQINCLIKSLKRLNCSPLCYQQFVQSIQFCLNNDGVRKKFCGCAWQP